jgi:hypothetical protein
MGHMDYIDLAQVRDRWQDLLKLVLNLKFRKIWEISRGPVSFSRRTVLHGGSYFLIAFYEFYLLFTDLTGQQMLTKKCLHRRFLIQLVIVVLLFGCVMVYYYPMVLEKLSFFKSSYKTDIINVGSLMKKV